MWPVVEGYGAKVWLRLAVGEVRLGIAGMKKIRTGAIRRLHSVDVGFSQSCLALRVGFL